MARGCVTRVLAAMTNNPRFLPVRRGRVGNSEPRIARKGLGRLTSQTLSRPHCRARQGETQNGVIAAARGRRSGSCQQQAPSLRALDDTPNEKVVHQLFQRSARRWPLQLLGQEPARGSDRLTVPGALARRRARPPRWAPRRARRAAAARVRAGREPPRAGAGPPASAPLLAWPPRDRGARAGWRRASTSPRVRMCGPSGLRTRFHSDCHVCRGHWLRRISWLTSYQNVQVRCRWALQ
jgi:hypothetical protein